MVDNDDKNGVPMQSYNREKSTFKMVKYHIFILLVLGIVALVLFLASRFSEDSIPIIIFFALLLIPLLIGFRDMLPDYIPSYFRNLLITTEENKPTKSVESSTVTVKTKQIYMTIAMSVVSLLLIILLFEIKPNLNNSITGQELIEKNIALKIVGGVILASFLGVLTMNFDNMHKLG